MTHHATSVERLGTNRGHTRNRCPKKDKKEETIEFHSQAYAIKDAEPQGLNSGYGFSSILDIDPVKIDTSYEVKLANGRVVSMNTVLKCCTLNLVNHLFKIDRMLIELGKFDVIIGMDWLVKHDVVIAFGEKVIRIPYGNKTLTVESDKGMSRLKKQKEKRLEDVPIIHDFHEVFPDDLLGLPPLRQVEFQIDLVPGIAPIVRAPYRLAPSEMREFCFALKKRTFQLLHLELGMDEEEHEKHLKIILELLKKERLYAKFSKSLPEGTEDFVVYYDASLNGYGAVLMQREKSEVGDSQLTDPELIRETTEKIVRIKNRLLTARSRQKSYADRRTKPLEFEVGDMVLLKVSPWKGAVRFGKRKKLSLRYIGPFKILARVSLVAYMLELPEELKGIHSTFHVSNLKKCLVEGDIVVPMNKVQLDDKLHISEEPVEIVDREVKRLKQSRIPIVKVH
uniref:Putative reverse transcriptase domain-containing protein n=1 Tax=Tanacetum cinerariifolium TaxID=118510 RepID=A0A699HMA7_TANCI|nr:putative reverse transcriptase domain-containing protein [Tanacetum cinerariifolium]